MKKNFKFIRLGLLVLSLSLLISGCGKEKPVKEAESPEKTEGETIKIGCMAVTEPIIGWIAEGMEKEGYTVEPVLFDGNHLPATALKEGSVDGVILNHKAWMETFNKENDANLIMPEPYMYYSRSALYSSKYDSLEEVPVGATIAVPGDPTNMSDSLEFLEELGFLKLGEKTGEFYSRVDIEDNIKDIEILETEITATARSIDDVDAIVCRATYIKESGRDQEKFLAEDESVKDIPLGLIIDKSSEDKDWVKKFLDVSETNEFRTKFTDYFQGTYTLFE